ncbi:thiamine phosphate synthase [Eubacterium sp. MSJ-33]|uniref:thiamine phosphate synthase n=1 Tax=Eubacterium sp. MSJ-33 TaxID=2841528 RepID=UPI001EE36091|nr:thiamine phosphate synthase [Eubacterium sp. MSJ-33]
MKIEQIAVTNRNICYELYQQAGLANAEDTPITCLARQMHTLMNLNSYDKILVREKDLSEKEYRKFITDIFSSQHLNLNSPVNDSASIAAIPVQGAYSDNCNSINSRIILHNFPTVAEEFATDLHLPFSIFTSLFNLNDTSFNYQTSFQPNTCMADFRSRYPHIQRIGTSIHSVEDAIFAEKHGANYITAGHIFVTDCKKGLPGRGIDWLRTICDAVSIPVYAIGGISDANVSLLTDSPIAGYCMMSESMRPILSSGYSTSRLST